MKKLLFIALTSAVVTFYGCSKSGDSSPQTVTPTTLKITVTNSVGSKVSGASVKLYATAADYTAAQTGGTDKPIATSTTDATGSAVFTADALIYYFFVQNGCENNGNAVAVTNGIISHTENVVSTVLSGTGTLKFINNSTNPYDIYVNGTVKITNMAGGTSQNLTLAPTGNYTIRVLQKSGYAVTPTDKTFTGTITCGGILTTTFP